MADRPQQGGRVALLLQLLDPLAALAAHASPIAPAGHRGWGAGHICSNHGHSGDVAQAAAPILTALGKASRSNPQVTMALKSLHKRGQHRREAFAAAMVAGLPQGLQELHHSGP